MQVFGDHLHSPNLWHLNRRSVSRGIAIGLFWALVPLPGQMIGAVATALAWGANVPVSLLLVWITNPLTMAPIFYCTYLLGCWLLNCNQIAYPDELTYEWFRESLGDIWAPLFTGSLTLGLLSAVIGYYLISWLWCRYVRKCWKTRHQH